MCFYCIIIINDHVNHGYGWCNISEDCMAKRKLICYFHTVIMPTILFFFFWGGGGCLNWCIIHTRSSKLTQINTLESM